MAAVAANTTSGWIAGVCQCEPQTRPDSGYKRAGKYAPPILTWVNTTLIMVSGPEPTEPKASVSVREPNRNRSGNGSGPDPTEPKASVIFFAVFSDFFKPVQAKIIKMQTMRARTFIFR